MAKFGRWVDYLNLYKGKDGRPVIPFEERPDAAKWTSGPYYRVTEIFTTVFGSWEKGDTRVGAIDDWAVDEWWSGSLWKGAGGDHNFFVKVLDKSGKPMPTKGLLWWQNALLDDPAKMEFISRNAWDDGTENIPVSGSYGPDRGEHGSFGCTTVGRADVVMGVGMPYNQHISVFVVFQQTEDAPPVPPVPPGDGDVVALLTEIRDILKAGFKLVVSAG